ncbi:hypothetical protein QR680_009723 [Steinernema hermaphroditum]|uniref:BZIP domain-containing protein n=1 Tax=Steinernema hermaphroditum TaxID=289476 RepID=A0AA39INX8_9BILA|nr:hypothetical protein QR680_009723 [Steinernema hermaphroditum]
MSPKEALSLPRTSSSPPSEDYEPQKKRGRPRMDDSEVIQDSATSDEAKSKIIYRRKYAREYRERIRADLQTKEEMRETLQRVEAENRQLKATLESLKAENSRILTSLIQSAVALQTVPVTTAPSFFPYHLNFNR